MTGGRILRLKEFLTDDRFMLTYGDGLANVNIKKFPYCKIIARKRLLKS